jgi:Dna[CI] antecedent, DciA
MRIQALPGESVFGLASAQVGQEACQGRSGCGAVKLRFRDESARFPDATIVVVPVVFQCCLKLRSYALNRASTDLETIVARALHRAPADESALLAWPVACGSAVADRTRALSFSDGILRVEVADSGWRRELAQLAPRYVAVINKYSAAAVKRIEFVVKA